MSNITLSFENSPVTFTEGAYLNATQIAKHFNKAPKDYLRLEQTKEYIAELSKGLNSLFDDNQLVIIKRGSSSNGGGTWLHPRLTIHFARWLSAKFAVWCDTQIEKILHPQVNAIEDQLLTNKTQENFLTVPVGKDLAALKGVTFDFDTDDQSFFRWFISKTGGIVNIQPLGQEDLCMSFDDWIQYATDERGYVVVKSSDVVSKLKAKGGK